MEETSSSRFERFYFRGLYIVKVKPAAVNYSFLRIVHHNKFFCEFFSRKMIFQVYFQIFLLYYLQRFLQDFIQAFLHMFFLQINERIFLTFHQGFHQNALSIVLLSFNMDFHKKYLGIP